MMSLIAIGLIGIGGYICSLWVKLIGFVNMMAIGQPFVIEVSIAILSVAITMFVIINGMRLMIYIYDEIKWLKQTRKYNQEVK